MLALPDKPQVRGFLQFPNEDNAQGAYDEYCNYLGQEGINTLTWTCLAGVGDEWLERVGSFFIGKFGIGHYAIAVSVFDGGLPSYDPLLQLQQERLMQLCTARLAVLEHVCQNTPINSPLDALRGLVAEANALSESIGLSVALQTVKDEVCYSNMCGRTCTNCFFGASTIAPCHWLNARDCGKYTSSISS